MDSQMREQARTKAHEEYQRKLAAIDAVYEMFNGAPPPASRPVGSSNGSTVVGSTAVEERKPPVIDFVSALVTSPLQKKVYNVAAKHKNFRTKDIADVISNHSPESVSQTINLLWKKGVFSQVDRGLYSIAK